MLLSFLSLTCGMILATVTRGRIEAKRLRYLQIPGQRAAAQPAGGACPQVPVAVVISVASDVVPARAQFLRFALVGCAGFVVDAGVLSVVLVARRGSLHRTHRFLSGGGDVHLGAQ